MSLDTTFLRRCIGTLETVFGKIDQHRAADDFLYDIDRTACVKEFGLVLEQSGKRLRKRLAAFFASNRQADRLAFKGRFRHAARHGLIEASAAERWFGYRDHRNDTAHDYGAGFAGATLRLLPDFIADSQALADMITARPDD